MLVHSPVENSMTSIQHLAATGMQLRLSVSQPRLKLNCIRIGAPCVSQNACHVSLAVVIREHVVGLDLVAIENWPKEKNVPQQVEC